MPTTRAASGPEPTRSPSDHSSCTPASTAAAMTAVSASPWAWTSPKTATRIALAAGVVEVLEPQLARRREEPPRRAARRADVAVDAADLVDADAAVADARVERGDREVAGARALHDGVVQLDTVDLHDVAVADLGGCAPRPPPGRGGPAAPATRRRLSSHFRACLGVGARFDERLPATTPCNPQMPE